MAIVNQRLNKLRALIIDDALAVRQNVRAQLAQLGIATVEQAGSADEAIHYIQLFTYDVIICEYNLRKETNGQQLLEYLRAQQLLPPSSLFIMVTAEAGYDFVASAAEVQPDAYMVKPLTGGKLLERIERLLDRQTALRAITARLEAKDSEGAVVQCDVLLQSDPRWTLDALKIKGNTLLDIGRFDEAKSAFEQALGLREQLVWAKMGIARCLRAAGELEEAKAQVQALLETDARYVAAYDLLAAIAHDEGNDAEALDALNRSYAVIPSARRSRIVGDAAYHTGDLEQAKVAYERTLKHTKGTLTAQPSDLLSLAQVHVDTGTPDQALKLLHKVPSAYTETPAFQATQAAVEAQAHHKMGNTEAAEAAFAKAKELADTTKADTSVLTLAKAAFAMGRDQEGAALLTNAVKADHENKRLVTKVRRVLQDTGKEHAETAIVDNALKELMAVVDEAKALMRQTRFDESVAKLEEALVKLPENTGVLLTAAQIYLIWMRQKGIQPDYLAKVTEYLAKLDSLMPGSERVAKMYQFMRETLVRPEDAA